MNNKKTITSLPTFKKCTSRYTQMSMKTNVRHVTPESKSQHLWRVLVKLRNIWQPNCNWSDCLNLSGAPAQTSAFVFFLTVPPTIGVMCIFCDV